MIYSYNTATSDYSVLFSFSGYEPYEGAGPDGGLVLDGSTFYGVAPYGGEYNDGVLFSLTLPEPGPRSILLAVMGCVLLRRRRRLS